MKSKVRSSGMTLSKLPGQTKVLNNEIMSLSSETTIKETYINDVENALRLNKQAANIMFAEQAVVVRGQGRLFARFRTVSWENMRLLDELVRQRKLKEDARAKHLITEQIRIQEQEFYQALVDQRDIRIQDLRKTLHDKQYNYNVIADRLNHYQDLQDTLLSPNNINADQILLDKKQNLVIAKLSSDKNRFKKEIKECREELARLKQEDERTKEVVRKKNSYSLVRKFIDHDGTVSEGEVTTKRVERGAEGKPLMEHTMQIKVSEDKITGEIRKLLKKEKVASQLIKMSLKESLEIGQKMRSTHQKLVQIRKSLNTKKQHYTKSLSQLQRNLTHYMFLTRPILPSPTGPIQPLCDSALLRSQFTAHDVSTIKKQQSSLLIKCGSEPTLGEERTRQDD